MTRQLKLAGYQPFAAWVWLADQVTAESGFVEQGLLVPLIEVRSRSEDLIDMALGPKTEPTHLTNQ